MTSPSNPAWAAGVAGMPEPAAASGIIRTTCAWCLDPVHPEALVMCHGHAVCEDCAAERYADEREEMRADRAAERAFADRPDVDVEDPDDEC